MVQLFFWAGVLIYKKRNLGWLIVFLFSFVVWSKSETFFRTPYAEETLIAKGISEQDLPRSYSYYTTVLQINPLNQKALFERGKVALFYGDYKSALKDFDKLKGLGFSVNHFESLLKNLKADQTRERKVLELVIHHYPKAHRV